MCALKNLALGIALVLSVACPLSAAEKLAAPGAEDWSSFRNGNQQLGVAGSKLPDKLELLWTYNAGEQIASTAAIVGDHVYGASLKGDVFCLQRKTGAVVWTYASRMNDDPKAFIPGFKASPTVTVDSVYIGDEEGLFHCIDRATGKQKWTFNTDAEIVSCATLFEDRVLFGSHDNSLYCLNAATGAKVWQFVTQGMVNCSPAIAGNFTFITGCDEHLRIVDILTGKETRDVPLGTYLIASPAVIEDQLFVGTYASEVIDINWKSGDKVWTYKDPDREFPYHSSAAVNERYVVVGGQDKRVHCIDRKSGKKVWMFSTKAKVNSSPAIVGDRVFVGSLDGNVYGLNLSDGKEVWRHTEGKPFSASPAVGQGCLVIGAESRDGPLHCFGKK